MKQTLDLPTRIAHILDNRNWHLIGPANQPAWQRFVDEVVEHIGTTSADDQMLSRAIIAAYCPILYDACIDQGSDRQRQAFAELWRWIYPRVYRRIDIPQDAEDVAQQVMLKVYQHVNQVKDPRGFLGWVSVITFREIGEYFRRRERESQLMRGLPPDPDDGQDNGDEFEDLVGPNHFLEMELRFSKEDLVGLIYACMPKSKRRQANVLVALVLEDRTVLEVAQELRIAPANVHILYFRAKNGLLQHCSAVIETLLRRLAPARQAAFPEGES